VSTDSHNRAERRGLIVSGGIAAAIGVIGIAWGLLAQSQIILFDGFYALIGLGLSWLGLRASQLIEKGPTDPYPFGRETLGPLVVGIQGLFLLGSLGYAALEAVQTLLTGPEELAPLMGIAYAAVTLVAAVLVALWLRTSARDSELLAAEAKQWWAGVVLAVVMLIGFGTAFVLKQHGYDAAAGRIDPILVIVAVLLLAPAPLHMLRASLREFLEAVPDPSIEEPVRATVEEVRLEEGLPEPTLLLSKLGRKLYVELDFLVSEDDGWHIGDADRLRRVFVKRLNRPGQVLWLNLELHTDPQWDVD
jgi:predicted Co/Zn/Cd cation transporter (cation efflux family)